MLVALCMACNLPIALSREIVCHNLFVEEVCSSMEACCRNCISGGNFRLIMVLSWLYWGIAGSTFPSNGKGVLEEIIGWMMCFGHIIITLCTCYFTLCISINPITLRRPNKAAFLNKYFYLDYISAGVGGWKLKFAPRYPLQAWSGEFVIKF